MIFIFNANSQGYILIHKRFVKAFHSAKLKLHPDFSLTQTLFKMILPLSGQRVTRFYKLHTFLLPASSLNPFWKTQIQLRT